MEKLKLLLTKVVSLLEKSQESGWSSLTPFEVTQNLRKQIENIALKKEIDKNALILEFAPTSTIQEISISNGWSKEYLELAKRFDQLICEVN